MTEALSDSQKIAWLEEQLAAANKRLDRVDPRPKLVETTNADVYLKRALMLTRKDGQFDTEAAADLFNAWAQQDSEMRASIKPIIREALDRRLELLKQEA